MLTNEQQNAVNTITQTLEAANSALEANDPTRIAAEISSQVSQQTETYRVAKETAETTLVTVQGEYSIAQEQVAMLQSNVNELQRQLDECSQAFQAYRQNNIQQAQG